MPTMMITNKLYQEIEQASKMLGATNEVVLENALSSYLAELKEDAEDARRAEKAWNDFQNSGEKTISADVLYNELGL